MASAVVMGTLAKLRVRDADPVEYALPVGAEAVPLNPLIGSTVRLRFEGTIACVHCGRATRKFFSQGYCFTCAQRLAACDICIVKPKLCHFAAGTCREPEWARTHCYVPHVVYLASSSGLKVGISRESQIPVRWIDQGASEALPVFRVASREGAGLIEAALRAHVADRTDWRRMLEGEPEPVDLWQWRDALAAALAAAPGGRGARLGSITVERLAEVQVTHIRYPVVQYPSTVNAWNLDTTLALEGTLMGIKGQYLILDTGVVNIRKHAGYRVRFAA